MGDVGDPGPCSGLRRSGWLKKISLVLCFLGGVERLRGWMRVELRVDLMFELRVELMVELI